MNVLPRDLRIQVLHLLIEGNSLSSVSRLTGVHRDTIAQLLVHFGARCKAFLNSQMTNLTLRHVQLDELWTFVGKKEKHVSPDDEDYRTTGDIYIFVAFDQDTKLVPAYAIGRRDTITADAFLFDLSGRLSKPKPHQSDAHSYTNKHQKYTPIVKITTDGWKGYEGLIDKHLSPYATYAQVVKNYSKKRKKFVSKPNPQFIKKRNIIGKMDAEEISTSLVERNNLTMRTLLRRLMRRTLGFSKKFENLEAATAVYMCYYNYCWKHKTLKTSPAHAAGLADRCFSFPALYNHLYKNVLVPWEWDEE